MNHSKNSDFKWPIEWWTYAKVSAGCRHNGQSTVDGSCFHIRRCRAMRRRKCAHCRWMYWSSRTGRNSFVVLRVAMWTANRSVPPSPRTSCGRKIVLWHAQESRFAVLKKGEIAWVLTGTEISKRRGWGWGKFKNRGTEKILLQKCLQIRSPFFAKVDLLSC